MTVTYDWFETSAFSPTAVPGFHDFGINWSWFLGPLTFDQNTLGTSFIGGCTVQPCDPHISSGVVLESAMPRPDIGSDAQPSWFVNVTLNADETLTGSIDWGDGYAGFRMSGTDHDWTLSVTGDFAPNTAYTQTGYWLHPTAVPEPASLVVFIALALPLLFKSLKSGSAKPSCRRCP